MYKWFSADMASKLMQKFRLIGKASHDNEAGGESSVLQNGFDQPNSQQENSGSLGTESSVMSSFDQQAVRIHLKNTKDLTEDGLRELCRPYGKVVDVRKPRFSNGNFAFVEFSRPSEAGYAIQELSRKLGFQFYPSFARDLNPTVGEMIAPPPPFEPAPGETLVPVAEDSDQEESWERTIAQRRIKSGFSIPLNINFPKRPELATASDYALRRGQITPLTRVDCDGIFCFSAVTEIEQRCTKDEPHSKIKKYLNEIVKRPGIDRVVPLGETYHDQPLFGHVALSEEESQHFIDLFCIFCRHRGFFRCAICDAVYCSKHCQQADYPKHKEICHLKGFKAGVSPPTQKKVTFEEIDDSSLKQEIFPKGSHVAILSVLSPERVFVRSLEKQSNRQYLQQLNDLAKEGLRAKPLQGTPGQGDICMAFYKPRKIYGRVLITRVTRTHAHCVFLEFGTVQVILFEQLKQIEEEELKLKLIRIHKIHLKDITQEYGHVEKAIEYLYSLIDQPLEMKAKAELANLVDAQLRTADGLSINQKINELIIIPVVKVSENLDNYIDYKTVAHKQLPVNKTIDVVVINRTTIKIDFRVTLIPYNELPYVEELQKKLQSYGKKVSRFTESYTPRLNELCLVRNMDTWYRAVLLEAVGDGRPTVYLCDYGCLLMVKLQDIRKIPASLALEVRTTDAKVYGLEEAHKAGVRIDSEFLDIYLEENERITVQTTEEVEFKEFSNTLTKEDTTMLAVIKVPDLMTFVLDRAHCG